MELECAISYLSDRYYKSFSCGFTNSFEVEALSIWCLSLNAVINSWNLLVQVNEAVTIYCTFLECEDLLVLRHCHREFTMLFVISFNCLLRRQKNVIVLSAGLRKGYFMRMCSGLTGG